jgi:hypothetical protein
MLHGTSEVRLLNGWSANNVCVQVT